MREQATFPRQTQYHIIRFMLVTLSAGMLMIVVYSIYSSQSQVCTNCFKSFLFRTGSGVVISGASFLLGLLLGGLFAIPRILQDGPGQKDSNGTNRYTHNDNLVQISDWLTKILVGVGLTQLYDVREFFGDIGTRLAVNFNHDNTQAGANFAVALIIYFLITGFLLSYLWCRLNLMQLFANVDLDLDAINKMLEEKEEENKKITEEKRASEEQLVSLADKFDKEVRAKGEQIRDLFKVALGGDPASNRDNTDPQKGKWGGQAEVNGRKLSASVKNSNWDENYFDLELEVTSTDPAKPLTDFVEFHLHPSFPNANPKVKVIRGSARLNLIAWGAFTIGAEADNGATKLELDLSTLEQAPEKFKQQ